LYLQQLIQVVGTILSAFTLHSLSEIVHALNFTRPKRRKVALPIGIVNFTRVLLVAFTILFPVVNPIGCAPIFLSMTQRYPESVQRIFSRKIAIYGFAILAVSLIFGTPILNFFGITIVVIQIAGGLLPGATGWNLLNEKEGIASESQSPATLEDALDHAFFL
jgi:multiple antibiotic resistance protein